MPVTVYVGLGANLGDSRQTLERALQSMSGWPECDLLHVSPLYRSEPQGFKDQPWFSNQVAALALGEEWTPHRLLQELLRLERELGRTREPDAPRFGPRVIDLDVLLYGNLVLQEADLEVPHPRMRDRAFVLAPLQDIAPDLVFPDGGSLREALAGVSYEVRGDMIFQK